MKVLFVDCLNTGNYNKWKEVIPLAPRRVLWILKKKKVDFTFLTYFDFLRKRRISKEFNVLMVSGMFTDLKQVRNVRNIFTKFNKKAIKIIGGPIAEDPKSALRRAGYDLGVIGEGEKTIEKLIENSFEVSDLSEYENLVMEKKGKIIFSRRSFLKAKEIEAYRNYDEILKEYPYYFASKVYVEVVRGCSNFRRVRENCLRCNVCFNGPLEKRLYCPSNIPPGCGYCSVPSIFGPARSLNADYIVEEIKSAIKNGSRRIVLEAPDLLDYGRDELVKPAPLTDPRNPPANLKALKTLFQKIFTIKEIENGEVAVSIENVKANLVDEKIGELLGKYFSGTEIHLGCETGDKEHAEKIARPAYPHEVINAVKILKKNGLIPHVYFIYGLPFQTEKTVKNTIRIIKECTRVGAKRILIYRFLPLPSSAFENFPKARVEDPLNTELRNFVRKINLELKKELIGRVKKYIVVEKVGKHYIGYPLKEGPNCIILGKNITVGKVYKVKIRNIRSNLVIGKVV